MEHSDWVAKIDAVGRRVSRGSRAARDISSLSRVAPNGPEIYRLGNQIIDGGWCSVAEINKFLCIEHGVQELFMRYGAISKFCPRIAISILAYNRDGVPTDVIWKNFDVDWMTLAASDGKAAVLDHSNGETRLVELDPGAPLMVPAGWAKDAVFSHGHGVTHTYRRVGDGKLAGVHYDLGIIYDWLPDYGKR